MNESQLVRAIKAHIDKGDKAKEKEQHYIAAGLHLKALKADHCGTWDEWEELLKTKIGIGKSRASELMQIADGRQTAEQISTDSADRKRIERKRKSLRDVTEKTDPETSSETMKAQFAAADTDDEDFLDCTGDFKPADPNANIEVHGLKNDRVPASRHWGRRGSRQADDGNGADPEAAAEDADFRRKVNFRAFVNRALLSEDDAAMDIEPATKSEWHEAIDAANRASAAWRKAASDLTRRDATVHDGFRGVRNHERIVQRTRKTEKLERKAAEIKCFVSKLIELDRDIGRALYDLLWDDDRCAHSLSCALGRGLGFDEGDEPEVDQITYCEAGSAPHALIGRGP